MIIYALLVFLCHITHKEFLFSQLKLNLLRVFRVCIFRLVAFFAREIMIIIIDQTCITVFRFVEIIIMKWQSDVLVRFPSA